MNNTNPSGPNSAPRRSTRRDVLWIASVALVYFATQILAFRFPGSFGLIAAIWPAAGIALASLLLSPRRLWPALLGCLFVAGLAANLTTDRPYLASVGFMIANICETFASAWLIRRWCGDQILFARVQEVVALTAVVCLVNGATALIGAGAAALVIDAQFWRFYRTWWIADGLGLLLVTPLIVLWAASWRTLAGRWSWRWVENTFLFGLGCMTAWLVFGVMKPGGSFEVGPYLLFVVVIWAAFRSGPQGTATFLCACSVIVIACTVAGLGSFPLGGADAPHRLITVQVFLGVMGLCGMLLAAVIAEHQQEHVALLESEERLRLSTELAGVAVWEYNFVTNSMSRSRNHDRLYGLEWQADWDLNTFTSATHPDDRARSNEIIQESAAAGGPDAYEFDFRVIHPDQSIHWLMVSGRVAERNEAGQGTLVRGCLIDITERKHADAQLLQAEDRFRSIFENATEGIFQTTPQGTLLTANTAMARILGYDSPEALLRDGSGMSGQVGVSPQNREEFKRRIEAAGIVSNFEYEIVRRDGSRIWVSENARVVRDAHGETVCYEGSLEDITQRRETSEALRQSLVRAERARQAMLSTLEDHRMAEAARERLLHILESSLNEIYVFDAESMHFEYVNRGALKNLGYTLDALKAMTPVDLKPEFTETSFREAIAPLLSHKEERLIFNTVHRRADGSLYPVEVHLQLVALPGRRVFLAVIQDITERRQAQDTQARLMMAVEHTAETIVITDERGVILYGNPALEKTSGYTLEEVIGRNPSILKSGKHDAEFYRRMWDVLSAGQVWSGFITNKRKDGTLFEEDVTISPVRDAAGRIINYVAVKRDVTEQKKLEAQVLRTQRLESIGTLAGGVAHDLNNMLAPIMMAGEMLRMEFPGTATSYLEMIQASAQRGADMVRQLLTFARGAEGERVLLQPVRLIKDLENMMKGSFPKNIQRVINWDPELPSMLGDPTQLHQVLLNLCVNARDAMPNGGTLTLEAQFMRVDATFTRFAPDARPGEYVRFRVRDTGTGIPPEILERIFDPFFSTKGPEKGTGLGLSTVVGIVKGHGGFLQVYSELGRGATFSVFLPIDQLDGQTEIATQSPKEILGHGETILFVDDEVAVRETARAVLQRLNFKPLTATDGADGLMQATQNRRELKAIITDLHMPHMDGLAFVLALRRDFPDIPVMVASGRLENDVAEKFRSLGVTNRLDKPFTEIHLAEALKKLLATK